MRITDAELIGNHGPTVLAVWPGLASAVRRVALEAAADGSFVLVVDNHTLERHASVRDGIEALRRLEPWAWRDRSLSHPQTPIAVESGPGYLVARFTLERSQEKVLAVADGHLLGRLGSGEMAAACAAFQELDPGALATTEDLYP